MQFNTIIIIDDNSDNKNKFMDGLKKELNFTYTKLEVIFQTCIENFPQVYNINKKESLNIFLDRFLNNLKEKDEIFLIDVNNLSEENANKLVEKNKNILIIYLKKIENEGKIISIDINNAQELEQLIKEIKSRMKNYGK